MVLGAFQIVSGGTHMPKRIDHTVRPSAAAPMRARATAILSSAKRPP